MLSILLAIFCFTVVYCHAEEAGRIVVTNTDHGEVHMRVFGDLNDSKDRIPVVCLPGANPALKDEWIPVATKLFESGQYIVVLVYTHMLHKEDRLSFIHNKVMMETLRASRIVIMGKSAGGSLAQEFALRHSASIISLVLAAPASSSVEHISELCPSNSKHMHPTFLAWAADDPSYAKSEIWLKHCRNEAPFVFYSAESGGHRVLPEYTKQIFAFLERVRLNQESK